MAEEPEGRARRRRPLYADPDLPTSIDIVNAYTGGGAAIRQRLAEPPKGVTILPMTFAVLLVIIGGWLTASAVATRRLAVDDIPAYPAVDVVDGIDLPVASVDRVVAVVLLEPLEPGTAATAAVPRPPARRADSTDPRINDQLRVTTRIAAHDTAGASSVQVVDGDPTCRWLPANTIGNLRATEVVCATVPSGMEVSVASSEPAQLAVVDRESVPTIVDRGYLWQGLLPLVVAVGLLVLHVVLVVRDRARRRRYEAALARAASWMPGTRISLN